MMDPFGLRIAIGLVVARLLSRGESMVKKWVVLPVLAIARLQQKSGGSLLGDVVQI